MARLAITLATVLCGTLYTRTVQCPIVQCALSYSTLPLPGCSRSPYRAGCLSSVIGKVQSCQCPAWPVALRCLLTGSWLHARFAADSGTLGDPLIDSRLPSFKVVRQGIQGRDTQVDCDDYTASHLLTKSSPKLAVFQARKALPISPFSLSLLMACTQMMMGIDVLLTRFTLNVVWPS